MRRLMIIMLCLPFVLITHAQTDSPPPRPIITPENAHQLTQITQLGRGSILDFTFVDDGDTMRVLSSIGIWDYDMTDLSIEPIWTELYLPNNAQFSPDGELILYDTPNQLFVYDVAQKQIIAQTPSWDAPVSALSFNATSDKIFFAHDTKIYEWDILNNEVQLMFTIREDFPRITATRMSPDGKILAGIRYCMDEDCEFPFGSPHQLWLWDTTTGEAIAHFDTHYVSSIRFNADSDAVWISEEKYRYETPSIRRLSLTTYTWSYPIPYTHTYDVMYQNFRFSPDEQIIAIAALMNRDERNYIRRGFIFGI